MARLASTPFHDRFDLDIALRDASLDAGVRPTRRMLAAASIGMEVEDAYFSARELREAVTWVHEGDPRGKPRLASLLSDGDTDDYQRCLYFCLAGRGVVAMLDDLVWLEALLEARGRVAGELMVARVRMASLADPYVAKEPDGALGTVPPDFEQGASWWWDPSLAR